MRRFSCPRCRERVLFEQRQCAACGTCLAFDPCSLEMRVSDGLVCANRALTGCNWLTDEGCAYCRACSLNRTIPNLGSQSNAVLWGRVETAKRRLVYYLYRLQLSFAGLSFDILSDQVVGPVTTGHLAGLITLNLAEADDVEREVRREAFREPYRTLLGHFRHEIGHFYWDTLIARSKLRGPFRVLFGDERTSYEGSLSAYHARAEWSDNHEGFVSEYAAAHPWEDWAETFAHFLHVVSTLDSPAAAQTHVDARLSSSARADPYLETDFETLLTSWNSVAYTMNELNRSMGLADAYPFRLTPAAKGKLHFVHMAVCGFRDRMRPKRASQGASCVSAVWEGRPVEGAG
jgi:hypothetical protein